MTDTKTKFIKIIPKTHGYLVKYEGFETEKNILKIPYGSEHLQQEHCIETLEKVIYIVKEKLGFDLGHPEDA